MKRSLVALVLCIAVAGGAEAAPLRGSLSLTEPRTPIRPTVSFRLVRDGDFDPDPVHHSGIVTRAEIAPNATLGLGLVKSSPKKPSGEWNRDSGARRSHKGLVSFLLKF